MERLGWRWKAPGSGVESRGCWGDGGSPLEAKDPEWEAERGGSSGEMDSSPPRLQTEGDWRDGGRRCTAVEPPWRRSEDSKPCLAKTQKRPRSAAHSVVKHPDGDDLFCQTSPRRSACPRAPRASDGNLAPPVRRRWNPRRSCAGARRHSRR